MDSVSASVHSDIGSLVTVQWEQREPGSSQVAFSADGEAWLQSPAEDRQAGAQQALLLGLPFGVEARFQVVFDGQPGEEHSIETGPLPEGLPELEIASSEQSLWDSATRYLLTSHVQLDDEGAADGTLSLILDRQGRVVWAWRGPAGRLSLQPRLARDARSLLVDLNSFYGAFDGGVASQVVALAIDGSEIQRWDTPGLHHTFTETGEGIAWAATDGDHDSLERVDELGEQQRLWHCEPFHQELGLEQACQANGLAWDAASERYLLSFFSTHSVVEVDGLGGQATRWFGQLPGAWSFDPAGSAFWWQHGAHCTADGTLLLSTQESALDRETLVREYALDAGAEALVQTWSFGDGEGIYGAQGGEVHRLGNGNTLHNYGSGARVREVTAAGDLAWDLVAPSGTYLGRTSPIEDLYALLP